MPKRLLKPNLTGHISCLLGHSSSSRKRDEAKGPCWSHHDDAAEYVLLLESNIGVGSLWMKMAVVCSGYRALAGGETMPTKVILRLPMSIVSNLSPGTTTNDTANLKVPEGMKEKKEEMGSEGSKNKFVCIIPVPCHDLRAVCNND